MRRKTNFLYHLWAKPFFLYHVPSGTDPNIQILKLCIVSDFRHINNVYNLYFRDPDGCTKKLWPNFFFRGVTDIP